MKTNEIRQKYLEFYESKGHRICASDVLVPKWDNTVLFTPAGMNQFKDHFLGNVEHEYTRATSSQKCLRTGDIENVGRTAYHHTFFEMLGNFSFGDYFKREAIHWAWEFLTDKKWLGIPADRLTVTVFLDDDEASDIWQKEIGLPLSRIERLGEHDNFWPAGAPTDGPDGVCGPCSEIFYHPDNGPECEIWNLVFTQFNRCGDPPNNLEPLPTQNIDTGMGLERIAATLQGCSTNYHIDTLMPIVNAAAEICGIQYEAESENGRRLRRITDHVRACAMSIHENVYPGSQKEEYVIRRLLRRAVLQGHEMGLRDPFLYKLVPEVVNQMSEPYPDLTGTAERVAQVIETEEKNFLSRLDDGLALVENIFAKMKSANISTVDGDSAAKLYQTYGFPAELFASIASERNCEFDWDGFHQSMDDHGGQGPAGPDGVMGGAGPIDEIKNEVKLTEFVGYASVEESAIVCGLVEGNSRSEKIEVAPDQDRESSQIVVLESTPYYAESGGQVGDTGVLSGPNGKFTVEDTQKNGDVHLHIGHVCEGTISTGDTLTASVEKNRRDAIRRAHSATHILHYALQTHLGAHAQQRGSKVTADWLRFDFTNMSPVTKEQLIEIEKLANDRIVEKAVIQAEILPLDSARERGAMMLFGEKYPDPVRMVSMGEFSKELCGGIHLDNTFDVGAFEIISEENVAGGTRRIEAITGIRAAEFQQQVRDDMSKLAEVLDCGLHEVSEAISDLSQHVKDLKKQVSTGKKSAAANTVVKKSKDDHREIDYVSIRSELRKSALGLNLQPTKVVDRVTSLLAEVDSLNEQIEAMANVEQLDADSLIESAEVVGGIQVIAREIPMGNSNLMRQLIDQVRKKTEPVAIFLAAAQGTDKVILVAGVSRSLVENGTSAGNWVKHIAPIVGGGGGGKPDLAQAGGKNPEKIADALIAAADFIKSSVVS